MSIPEGAHVWSIMEQTVTDLVTGLRFRFEVKNGNPYLTVTRHGKGDAVLSRDFSFHPQGGESGSGSGLAEPYGDGLPINPEVDDDDTEAWKRG